VLPAGGLVADVDAVDVRATGAATAPLDDAVDGRGRTFEDGLDAPVGEVADPAAHAGGLCLVPARFAEPDALDASRDNHAFAHGHVFAVTAVTVSLSGVQARLENV
jgi:hypothetical protein